MTTYLWKKRMKQHPRKRGEWEIYDLEPRQQHRKFRYSDENVYQRDVVVPMTAPVDGASNGVHGGKIVACGARLRDVVAKAAQGIFLQYKCTRR